MFFHPKNLKSENNNPWFKPWFNILLHTQSIVCATLDSQCLEYLGYMTLILHMYNVHVVSDLNIDKKLVQLVKYVTFDINSKYKRQISMLKNCSIVFQ